MPRSVVLLSGGLDSAYNLKFASDRTVVASAVTFDYGQRASAAEIRASAAMCGRLAAPHRVIALPWLAHVCRSALTDGGKPLPRLGSAQLDDAQGAAAEAADKVWVPNRNGTFLNIAAAIAEGVGAATIHVGFNAEEAATFPDNTGEFVEAANAALAYSTRGKVRITCATLAMRKEAIVREGLRIGAPLDLAWPCYEGGERLCGSCESCMRFLRAVDRAGAKAWFVERHARMPRGTRRDG